MKDDEDRAHLSECGFPQAMPCPLLIPLLMASANRQGTGPLWPVPELRNPFSNPSYFSLVLKVHCRVFSFYFRTGFYIKKQKQKTKVKTSTCEMPYDAHSRRAGWGSPRSLSSELWNGTSSQHL